MGLGRAAAAVLDFYKFRKKIKYLSFRVIKILMMR